MVLAGEMPKDWIDNKNYKDQYKFCPKG